MVPAAEQQPSHMSDSFEVTKMKSNTNRIAKTTSKPKRVSRPVKASKLATAKEAPIYDEMGYEIDPVKVANAQRRPRKLSPTAFLKMLEDDQKANDRKAEIMGTSREHVSAMTTMAWDDRVARELGKPFHKVAMEDYEEIHRRGILFHPDEFVEAKMPKEEVGRIVKLATGSIFRK